MKKFITTLPGKVLLFLVFLLTLAVSAACITVTILALDAGLYGKKEEDLLSQQITGEIYSQASACISAVTVEGVSHYRPDYNMEARVTNRGDRVVYESPEFEECLKEGIRERILIAAVDSGRVNGEIVSGIGLQFGDEDHPLQYYIDRDNREDSVYEAEFDGIYETDASEPPVSGQEETEAAEQPAPGQVETAVAKEPVPGQNDTAVAEQSVSGQDGETASPAETAALGQDASPAGSGADSRTDQVERQYYKIYMRFDPSYVVEQTMDPLELQLIRWFEAYQYLLIPVGILAVLLCLFSLIALLWGAGRRAGWEGPHPGLLAAIPFDVLFLIICTLVGIILAVMTEFDFWGWRFLAVACAGEALAALGLIWLMDLIARIRCRTLKDSTLSGRLILWGWRMGKRCLVLVGGALLRVIRIIPLVPMAAAVVLGICALEFIGMLVILTEMDWEWLPVVWFLEKLVLVPLILTAAFYARRLQESAKAIAAGDLTHRTETKGMVWEFKKHGEYLNDISGGMARAVEQGVRSERMKTELITNVSHDLKTPLTSIVNYASLIAQEPVENERVREYSEVLVRQSTKLKRLIEDLVEASKATTGNLEVAPVPCDPATFISQAGGEYEEKLAKAGLTMITSVPEEDILIMADGRRMWRVFDNLMNNIAKYSQSGTRVYLDLKTEEDRAVITFRNTSRDALNISAEELMERFVRGDSSRNTEGNGLGLSIARSLVELQKGTFRLDVDGDLFKVTLTFPRI